MTGIDNEMMRITKVLPKKFQLEWAKSFFEPFEKEGFEKIYTHKSLSAFKTPGSYVVVNSESWYMTWFHDQESAIDFCLDRFNKSPISQQTKLI